MIEIETKSLTPILNRWAMQQEKAAFELLRDLCQGKDVDGEHPLREKISSNRSWHIASMYGLWQPIIEQVYEGFHGSGSTGARMAIMVLCTTGGDLCTLFSRYDPGDELELFRRR